MNAPISAKDLGLIANLIYDKGYMLLMDYMQSVLDGHMERLSDPSLSAEDSLRQLQHWRALREVYANLVNQPQYYAQQAAITPDEDTTEALMIRTNTGYQSPPAESRIEYTLVKESV